MFTAPTVVTWSLTHRIGTNLKRRAPFPVHSQATGAAMFQSNLQNIERQGRKTSGKYPNASVPLFSWKIYFWPRYCESTLIWLTITHSITIWSKAVLKCRREARRTFSLLFPTVAGRSALLCEIGLVVTFVK